MSNLPPPAQPAPAEQPTNTTARAWSVGPINARLAAAKRHGAGFVGRFKQVDFKREVWPLDSISARTLTNEPAFWAVTLLSALPLFFTTLNQLDHQLVAFAVYFAVIWGLIFRFNVIPGVQIGWGWLATVLLFTATAGVFILNSVYGLLPAWYYNLPDDSHDALTRLFGFIFRVGVCEETCKIIPVVVLMIFLRKRLSYSDIVMIGIFSGLGFATVENLQYFHQEPDKIFKAISSNSMDSSANDPDAAAAAFHSVLVVTSQSSILMALSRTISCTFGHAVYTGIFAHFLAQGRGAGVKQIPLWIVGLMTAAAFHGAYDWLWKIQVTLPVLVTVLSFMLLKLYIVQGTDVPGSAPRTATKNLTPE